MEVGLVHKIDIDQEMQQAYLDYAMSVIVARALPDARDGLKPVHRRILYAMYDMGLRPDSQFKKSARIVGEVLGKYHPHGDMTVYEAMARMAQDFSMRYMLVNGQGNFGSVDGDPPAAMRYTEARLTEQAIHMLADINKATVDFTENFDGTLSEPTVLPAAAPNLLINGSTGIAVGMATSIPPHNLGEVVSACQHLLANWEKSDDITVEDLMEFIQGPDFPTGGMVIHGAGEDSLVSAYSTGRGRITVQARTHLEEMERGRNRIIVTELPYMTNKSSLIERIADMTRDEKVEGIVDLRDESDRQGMRIVIEMSKTTDPEAVLRDLYRYTPMQVTFSIIMLALVDGEPRLISLKQALRVYLEHRLEIVRRRSEFDLARAKQRAHILEGLIVALKNLDEIVAIIRRSPDVETARTRLMRRYKLSEEQSQAILDMPLRRLAALERKKIEDEYKETLALIKSLEALLRSPKKMRQVVSDELEQVETAYGDRRRTHIVQLKEGEEKTSLLTATDIVEEKDVWISVTKDGLVSHSLDDKQPRLSGWEAPTHLVKGSTRDTLYLVNENGDAAAIPMHAVPGAEKTSDGIHFSRISPLRDSDTLAALFVLPPRNGREDGKDEFNEMYVLTVSRLGMVKRSALSDLPGPSANTFTLVRINDGDRLGWLRLSRGKNEVLLLTKTGMAIRFSEEEVRAMGLIAAGVIGIKLQGKDEVVGMELLPQPGDVFMVATNGYAKRVKTDQFPKQGRYGQGVVTWKLPARVEAVGITIGKGTTKAILHLTKLAPKSFRLDDAPLQGRTAQGKSIQALKAGEKASLLTVAWEAPRPGTQTPATRTAQKRAPATSRTTQKTATRRTTTQSSTGKKPASSTAPKQSAGKSSSGKKTTKSAVKKPITQKTAAKKSTRTSSSTVTKTSTGTKSKKKSSRTS